VSETKASDGSLDYAAPQIAPSFFGADPALEMMRLTSRIVMDRLPCDEFDFDDGITSIGYIHALSPDDAEGNLDEGAFLIENRFINRLYILGLGRKYKGQYASPAIADDEPACLEAQMSHSGFRVWRLRLNERGVENFYIGILRLEQPEYQARYYHTHAEAVSLVQLIKGDRSIARLFVVSSGWHIVRAACEVVSQVIVQGLAGGDRFLPVYIVPAWESPARAWTQKGLGSQSTVGAKTPLEELENELAKLKAYCAKGDLKTAQEILAYFDQRDALYPNAC
jgi:hypothetical protein